MYAMTEFDEESKILSSKSVLEPSNYLNDLSSHVTEPDEPRLSNIDDIDMDSTRALAHLLLNE